MTPVFAVWEEGEVKRVAVVGGRSVERGKVKFEFTAKTSMGGMSKCIQRIFYKGPVQSQDVFQITLEREKRLIQLLHRPHLAEIG